MPPVHTSDLIFGEQANHNFSRTLGELKRSALSIHNRLRSVLTDAAFVQEVAEAYGRPVIANERCGSWYIHPEKKAGSAYFKSTDGHTGVWDFSTRRLNLQLLEHIGKHDGCIIIDSTRRGKRMPDALSKTVPIWCCVLNRILFPDQTDAHKLYTPPQVVSASEHAQIEARLSGFVQSFRTLDVNVAALRQQISKPLRPLWITPESYLEQTDVIFEDFHPVILCTTSRRVIGAEISEGGYIQGSGDDTENWAHGLEPPIFWANEELLLSTSEEELPALIVKLVEESKKNTKEQSLPPAVLPTTSMIVAPVGALSQGQQDSSTFLIHINPEPTPAKAWESSLGSVIVGLGENKLASKNLRTALPYITNALIARLSKPGTTTNYIIVACSTGKDVSVGVALALLCLFYNDEGVLVPCDEAAVAAKQAEMGKIFIRRRLGWIMTSMPDVNPKGATLQSVNSFLMKPPI